MLALSAAEGVKVRMVWLAEKTYTPFTAVPPVVICTPAGCEVGLMGELNCSTTGALRGTPVAPAGMFDVMKPGPVLVEEKPVVKRFTVVPG